jgi:hypothetical protein
MGPVLMTWLGRREHLPVLLIYYINNTGKCSLLPSQVIIYYPATILAKHKVSVARIPTMQAKKFTIYSKHSIPQPGNMNLPLGSHAA